MTSPSRKVTTSSPDETQALGARVGRQLQPGDVLLLQGDLGAGKTVFAQGIGEGLEVAEPVKSSSFVLVNEYHGRLTVQHADLYRLEDPAEVFDLGLEEIAAAGVLIVEWPERAWSELPEEHLLVRFEHAGEGRTLDFEPHGQRYKDLVKALGEVAA